MNRRIFIGIGVVMVIILIASLILSIFKQPAIPPVNGTVTLPQFAVISGDIDDTSAHTIVSIIRAQVQQNIPINHIVLRASGYKKTFTDTSSYSVRALIDTVDPASTYLLNLINTDGQVTQVTVGCAPTNDQIDPRTGCLQLSPTDGE